MKNEKMFNTDLNTPKSELEERIKKLTADAEEELLSVLSSDQRKKFREKIGTTFDFGEDAGGRGRRAGRDRGDRNRGGDNDF